MDPQNPYQGEPSIPEDIGTQGVQSWPGLIPMMFGAQPQPFDPANPPSMGTGNLGGILNMKSPLVTQQMLMPKLMEIPVVRELLKYLQDVKTPVNVVEDPGLSRGVLGNTRVFTGPTQIPSLSSGLIGTAKATPATTTSFAKEVLPYVERGSIGHFSPTFTDPYAHIQVRLNPYMLADRNGEMANTLIHELNHAGLNLVSGEEGLTAGKQAMQNLSKLPLKDRSELGVYPAWQLPAEAIARNFANQYNPYQ